MEDGSLLCATAGAFVLGASCAVSIPTETQVNIVVSPDDVYEGCDEVTGLPLVAPLNNEQWEWLNNMLDEPPRDLPYLQKLFAESGVRG